VVKKSVIAIVCIAVVLCCRSYASEDLLLDYFLPRVEVRGDKKEIAIYREFASYYVEIKKNIEADDYKSAFSIIDEYVVLKSDYLKQEASVGERFYLSGFISSALYMKALTLFQFNPNEAIELFYYAYTLVHEEHRRIGMGDIIGTAFSTLVGPILYQGTVEQDLSLLRKGVLPPNFIAYTPEIERKIQAREATADGHYTLISAVVPEDFDKYMSIFQGFRYFKYLKPLERVLLITYNPKNRKALSYIKELQKASGLRIRKQKDYSYDSFQMYARIDPEFAQQIFRKYYEKRS